MAWIPQLHDGGYADVASTYPGPLVSSHAGALWTDEQSPPGALGSPQASPQHSIYDGDCRPRGGSVNSSPKPGLPQDEENENLRNVLAPNSILALGSEDRIVDESVVEEMDTADPRLMPRGYPLMAPPTPPRSNNSIDQLPISLQQHSATAREILSPPVLAMSTTKLMSQPTFPSPGPGPGPGPGLSLKRPSPVPEAPGLESRGISKTSLASLQVDWQKIRRLRLKIWSLRDDIQDSRKALREKQLERSIADDRYFQHVRMLSLGVTLENQDISKPQRSTAELMEDCQRIRDEYGPMEDDCNLLEDQLQREEFRLTQLEKSYNKRQSEPEAFQKEMPNLGFDSHETSSYGESEVGQETHPLVSQYLYKLGEADNLKDRLDEHIEEKFVLLDQKEARQLVGQELDADDQEWLDQFDDLEDSLMKEIREIKAEAEHLKQLCFEEGLVDEDGNPTDFEKQERTTFLNEAPDVDAGKERSEFVKFPVLIPGPGSKDVQLFRNSAPKAADMSNSAGDHINQWLLHQLRSSPLDVSLLARTFEAESGLIKGEEWQFDVLAFWYKDDGARKEASTYRIYSSGIATQAPRNSRFSVDSYMSESEKLTFEIVRSTSLQDRYDSGSGSLGSDESTERFGPVPPPPFHRPKLGGI